MCRFLYGQVFLAPFNKYQRMQLLDHLVRVHLILLRNCQTEVEGERTSDGNYKVNIK
jgi:hypothetical protein